MTWSRSTPSRPVPPVGATSCGARPSTRRPNGWASTSARPRTLKDADAQAEFAALNADLAVVGAYGLLLPKPVLAAPRLGCINLHASLLPRWRGAAPIERAILAGDRETGISIFQMEEGLDTGPVFAMRPLPIGPSTDRSRAARAAGRTRRRDAAGGRRRHRRRQPARPSPSRAEGVVYAHKLARDEGRLDFTLPAVEVERRLRALNPAPGCLVRGQRRAADPARGRGCARHRRARHRDRTAVDGRLRHGRAAGHSRPAGRPARA